MFLPTSQWSLEACQGADGSNRRSALRKDSPFARSRDAERICRAIVAFTTPDGVPVLRRPLSPPERKRLAARVADLEAALGPARRALAQVSAVLRAPVCGDLLGPQRNRCAEEVFRGNKLVGADTSAPSAMQNDEVRDEP